MKTANPDIKDNKNICENKSEFIFIITISTQNQKCIDYNCDYVNKTMIGIILLGLVSYR